MLNQSDCDKHTGKIKNEFYENLFSLCQETSDLNNFSSAGGGGGGGCGHEDGNGKTSDNSSSKDAGKVWNELNETSDLTHFLSQQGFEYLATEPKI